MTGYAVALALLLFLAAGLCEIGGGWLVWKWRRDKAHWLFFVMGCLVLVAYGLLPTFQTQDFARTYAVYGGFFIVLSLLWGWALDGEKPGVWDCVGAAVALAGVCIVMFARRG